MMWHAHELQLHLLPLAWTNWLQHQHKINSSGSSNWLKHTLWYVKIIMSTSKNKMQPGAFYLLPWPPHSTFGLQPMIRDSHFCENIAHNFSIIILCYVQKLRPWKNMVEIILHDIQVNSIATFQIHSPKPYPPHDAIDAASTDSTAKNKMNLLILFQPCKLIMMIRPASLTGWSWTRMITWLQCHSRSFGLFTFNW